MTGRRLSSSLTLFWKVVLPGAWITGFVTCAESLFFVSRGQAPDPALQSLKLGLPARLPRGGAGALSGSPPGSSG